MSTPPPQPGQGATLDRSQPADATAAPPAAAGPAAPRRARYGIHQVLWGIGGVITGLAVGILGTGAESGPATAATSQTASAPAAKPAAAARALPGKVMAGEGLFVIGHDIRRGTWHTPGAVGGATGECYVALLRGARASSVIDSEVITGSGSITTTSRTRAIRTSGCRTWHRVAGPGPATASSRSHRSRAENPGNQPPARIGGPLLP
jgi:hypothetical protein